MARKNILIRDPSSEMRNFPWNSQCLRSTSLEQNSKKIVGNFEPKLRFMLLTYVDLQDSLATC